MSSVDGDGHGDQAPNGHDWEQGELKRTQLAFLVHRGGLCYSCDDCTYGKCVS